MWFSAGVLAFTSALLFTAAPAAAKAARCEIKASGGAGYRGACQFVPERRGSFTVRPLKAARLTGQTVQLSVDVIEPGLAEVRGLTAAGVNSRWGEARRSRRNRACWDGVDFRICVY